MSWLLNLSLGIAAGIISTLVVVYLHKLKSEIVHRHPLSGIWHGEVRNLSGEVIKRDEYNLDFTSKRNSCPLITGTIIRRYPDEPHLEWDCWGKLVGKRMVLVCWNENENRLSSATLQQGIHNRYFGAYINEFCADQEIGYSIVEIKKKVSR